MSTRFTRLDETRRVYFRVERNGVLLPGVSPGSFTTTLVNPLDSSSTTVSVVESTEKGGLYYFDVPAAFVTVRGDYTAVVEIDNKGPNIKTTFSIPLVATQEDVDTIADGLDGDFDRTQDTLVDISAGGGGGGGGLTPTESTQLLEVWRILGLDATEPLSVTRTQRSVGAAIIQRIVELTGGTVTITRQ